MFLCHSLNKCRLFVYLLFETSVNKHAAVVVYFSFQSDWTMKSIVLVSFVVDRVDFCIRTPDYLVTCPALPLHLTPQEVLPCSFLSSYLFVTSTNWMASSWTFLFWFKNLKILNNKKGFLASKVKTKFFQICH